MMTRTCAATVARAALPLFALVLGACALQQPDRSDDDPYRGTDVSTARDRPERYHFYAASDPVNVHYYDTPRPDEIVTRSARRAEDGRTYYIEREGGAARRFYYDENTARTHGRSRDDLAVAEKRTHYYETWDAANVYYFEASRPDVVVTRRILRDPDGRTYYVDREGLADRRTYFDDATARSAGRERDDRVKAQRRTHYYERWDDANVYYFETGRPDTVFNRPIIREPDGRAYYVEREGTAERRFYFDDAAARVAGMDRDRDHDRDHD